MSDLVEYGYNSDSPGPNIHPRRKGGYYEKAAVDERIAELESRLSDCHNLAGCTPDNCVLDGRCPVSEIPK